MIGDSPDEEYTDPHGECRAEITALRSRCEGLERAMDRYRYAVAWAASDSWDLREETVERFEWARANDPTINDFDDARLATMSGEFLHTPPALRASTSEGL